MHRCKKKQMFIWVHLLLLLDGPWLKLRLLLDTEDGEITPLTSHCNLASGEHSCWHKGTEPEQRIWQQLIVRNWGTQKT